MKLVIAEKPSVGNSIARMIGADRQRGDGFTSGNGYIVSWCFGHLVALSSPEEYDKRYAKPWKLSNLPIIPADFQLIPRQVKAEKGYKADPGVLKQLKVIKEVFDQCDRIIVATDAGRDYPK